MPELLREVERRNPEFLGRQAQARAAAERPTQAGALEDPMLMLELWQVPVSLGALPLMITLRQPLPWPGKRSARAAALLPEVDRARAESDVAWRTLRLATVRAYYEYRLAVRLLEVLREDQQLLSLIAGAVQVRYQAGRADLAEVLRAQEALASMDNDLMDRGRDREVALGQLNALRSAAADQPLGAPLSGPPPEELALPALDALTTRALQTRPELRVAAAEVARAQALGQAARAERAPDLALWAGYMASLRGGEEGRFTLGVQSSLPSFSLSGRAAAGREAAALSQAGAAQREREVLRVRAEVREALLQVEAARRHLRLHRQTLLPLSQRAVAAAQLGYQGGRVELPLVLDAARALFTHRREYERFAADYAQRLAELEAAVGAPLFVAGDDGAGHDHERPPRGDAP